MIKKIIGLLVVVAIIIAAVTLVKKRKQAVDDTPTASVMLTTVKTYKPTVKEISESETFLATLQAVNQPQISSKTSGYINKIYVKESQAVKKGELLIEIDNTDIVSSVESLKASQLAAKRDLSLTYKSLKRSKALFDIGGISRESYEMAQLAVENKKAKLITYEKNIKAKENLLTYTKIHAPIDGKVGTIFIKEGSLSAPGKPILDIVAEDKRLVFSYAPNTAIKAGQKVEVIASDDLFAIISPAISQPVGVGSEAKLSRLPAIKNIKVVFDGK